MTVNALMAKAQDVWQRQGVLVLLWKTLRFVPLRFKLYVCLPVARLLGIPTPLKLLDRKVLEQDIFGWLAAKPDVKRVLFAGIESYTWHYYRFFPKQDFQTIDFVPKQAFWGRKGFHTVGSVTELDKHYPNARFDAVVYNGIIGWGLNAKADVDMALRQAHAVLAKGGILVIGWDNEPRFIDFPLEELEGYKLFRPLVPEEPGLESHRYEASPLRHHTYDFLIKE